MTIAIDLNGDPAFDLDIQARSTRHGRVEWKPATNEYRVVKANGTKVAISGTQTRPKNRCLSNIGLDDPQSPAANSPQCLWDNAAFEPAIERIAPPSFTGNAVASWRLFDDADRCWWVVVEAVSDQLVVWLHRPATIFLQAMQPLQENCRELHRFYLPEHLVGERVHVATSPRGNQAILQVITDKADLPLDSAAGAAPERYTLPWAQFVRVLDFTGTGSWPELPDDPDWGVGIESDASLYVSPYSAGTGTLSTHRKRCYFGWELVSKALKDSGHASGSGEGDTYDWWAYSATYQAAVLERDLASNTATDYHVELAISEVVSAPVVLMFDDQGQVVEVSAHIEINESHTSETHGVKTGGIFEWDAGGGRLSYPSGSEEYSRTDVMDRAGAFSVIVKVDGMTKLDVQHDINGRATRQQTDQDAGFWSAPGVVGVYRVNDREYNADGAGRIVSNRMIWFNVQFDAASLVIVFGESSITNPTRNINFYRVIGVDGEYRSGYWLESTAPDDRVYLNHDSAGRRFDEPLPAQYNGVDAGDGSDKRDVSHYICHYVMGRGQDGYIQRGLVHQWEDFDAWMVLGYC